MLQRIVGVLICLLSITAFANVTAQVPTDGDAVPAFTGFVPMSELHLQEGFLRPYDNVSMFGWEGVVHLNDGKLHFTGPVIQTPLHLWGFSVIPQNIYSGTDTLRPGGMTPIFDGNTLDGWIVLGESEAGVVDGAIRLTKGLGALESAEKYGDFVLQLEYFTPVRPAGQGVNSGVFFRCIPGELLNGYECQILNRPGTNDINTVGSVTGSIFHRQTARNVEPKDGEWNYLTIAARGNRIATWVNGIHAADWIDERKPHDNPRSGNRTKPGTIQLQGHDAGTEVLFRNIRIRTL